MKLLMLHLLIPSKTDLTDSGRQSDNWHAELTGIGNRSADINDCSLL